MKGIYTFAFCTALFLACNSASKDADNNKSTELLADSTIQRGKFKNADLDEAFSDYLMVKSALVKSDANKVASNALTLATSLDQIGQPKLQTLAKTISSEKDIAKQRTLFTELSNGMIDIAKKSPLASGTVYVQHCPMANNGDGGDWLSAENKIQNPYYGDEMLECGAVIEEIKQQKK